MYLIEKTFKFEASHRLPYHDGKCSRLHGHSWVGKVTIKDYDLHTSGPKTGMVMDFGDLSAVLNPIVEESLDHWHLNDTTGLASPTSENLARWLYNKLKPLLTNVDLVSVRIEETCSCAAEYHGDPL